MKNPFCEIYDHSALTSFYLENELEISEGWEKESGVFLSEVLTENLSPCRGESKIIAAYSLSHRYGVTVLDYIAVAREHRKSGLGSTVLERIKEKIREGGKEKIYLTAKAGGFFLKNGAELISEHSPLYKELLGDCTDCPQRGVDCFPKAMEINA